MAPLDLPTPGGSPGTWGSELNQLLSDELDGRLSDAQLSATIARKGMTVFNVKDYGAVGDGVADDTAAIQAAVNACEAAGGGIVYLPPGIYRITANITVSGAVTDQPGRGGVTVRGAAARATKVKAEGGITAFTFPNVTGGKWHIQLESMEIAGPGKTVVGSRGWFWDKIEATHLFRDLWVHDFEAGAEWDDSTGGQYHNVVIRYCGTGIRTGYNHDIHTYLGCRFDRCDTAIQIGFPHADRPQVIQETSAVIFQSCRISNNTVRAVWVNDPSTTALKFDGCYFESNPKEFEVGVSGRDDGASGPLIDLQDCYFTQPGNEIAFPRPIGFDVFNKACLRFLNCATDAPSKYTVFVKLAYRDGIVTFQQTRIGAVTADVQWSGRNWKVLAPQNTMQIQGRHLYQADAGFQSEKWFDYGLSNFQNHVFASWKGLNGTDLSTQTELQIRDIGGVTRLDGITSAFIAATSVASLPTAGVNYRGCFAYVPGNGTTTADALYTCLMSATGTYSWKQIVAG